MALTYASEAKGYTANTYLRKRVGPRRVLVTAEHGGWAVLSDGEFELLRLGKVQGNPTLYGMLEQQGIIITENNAERIAGAYRSKFCQVYEGTTLHIITPTLRCNQACVYCYAGSKPSCAKGYDMARSTAGKVLDFVFQCPARDITIEFQGGEPLLNFPVLKYIVERGRRKARQAGKNVGFRLVSNLTRMDLGKLRYLTRHGVEIHTSLDGPASIHDRNRLYEGGGGTYADMVKWVVAMKKKGIPHSCMPTITRHSLPYWKEIIDEYVRLGIGRFWARRLNTSGSAAKTWSRIGYSAEEFLAFWKRSLDYIFELNRKGVNIREGYLEIALRNIVFSRSYNRFVCMASPCGCALGQASYNQDGDIYTCDEGRSFPVFRIGNVRKDTYAGLYSSSKVLDIIGITSGGPLGCSACAYHPFCGPCLVDSYGEQGNIIQRPNSFDCRIKKGVFDHIFSSVLPDKEKCGIAMSWLNMENTNC